MSVKMEIPGDVSYPRGIGSHHPKRRANTLAEIGKLCRESVVRYSVLSVLFLFLIYLEVQRGPGGADPHAAQAIAAAAD